MTLGDIINAVGKRDDWVHFMWDWGIGEYGVILPTLPVKLTLDSEAEVHYQWFWHCNPDLDMEAIYNAIEEHDFETFTKFYDELEFEPLLYLPSEADIFVENQCVGTVCIAYSPEAFALITSQDHECG